MCPYMFDQDTIVSKILSTYVTYKLPFSCMYSCVTDHIIFLIKTFSTFITYIRLFPCVLLCVCASHYQKQNYFHIGSTKRLFCSVYLCVYKMTFSIELFPHSLQYTFHPYVSLYERDHVTFPNKVFSYTSRFSSVCS